MIPKNILCKNAKLPVALAASLLLASFAAAAPSAPDTSDAALIKTRMNLAFRWQITHRTTAASPVTSPNGPCGWVHGAFLTGVLEAWRATGDKIYLDYVWKWAEQCEWKLGPRPQHADDHIVAQSYLELAEIDATRANLAPTIATFDRLLAEKHKGAELLWWSDSLYMQPAAWARLAKVTGKQKYLDEMIRLFWDSAAFLYDQDERLFYRDKGWMPRFDWFKPFQINKDGVKTWFQERNGKKMFWSRGNGWVFGALPRIMDCMPPGTQRARFEALFKDMAGRILELQSPDGLWRMGLLHPEVYGYGEESGSAFFLYGLAWGVRNGLLDKTACLPALERGWRALKSCQRPDGMVGYVQPPGAAPGRHSAHTYDEYGTGAFLLAASELLKLTRQPPDVFTSLPRTIAKEAVRQRAYQIGVLKRVAGPVLAAAAEGRLKDTVTKLYAGRDRYAAIEAFARTLNGIAPWLELGPGSDAEGKLRAEYIGLAVKAIRCSTDPDSPVRLPFGGQGQPLVDTGFFAQALLRAPTQLWGNLDAKTKAGVIECLKASRAAKPGKNNWELFSATIEAALLKYTGECNMAAIELAVNDHEEWYKGDGVYGDGRSFHWDYYNSFVIQPMLWDVLAVCAEKKLPPGRQLMKIQTRAQRYAEIQERMISPEGTFPVIGRSSAYRFGAFQTLSLVALKDWLPQSLPRGAVRSALNTVIERMIEVPGTFNEDGWLQRGVVGGEQPLSSEYYINTGSLYLCLFGLLQLGLPADDPFWTEPDQPWTQKRIWSGKDIPADHAL
jgi:rhamnogalacturonyl hydrolase YesR